jgi:predicted ATPase
VLLFTSNRPCGELYAGGLSRRYFLPFVELLEARLVQVRVGGGLDYRLEGAAAGAGPAGAAGPGAAEGPDSLEAGSRGGGGYMLVGAGAQLGRAGEALRRRWGEALRAAGLQEARAQLPVGFGRALALARAAAPPAAGCAEAAAAPVAAFFTFEELCGGGVGGQHLSQVDCLALAQVDCLYLQGLPQLGPARRDEARRLVTLLDVLYDAGTALRVSAAVPPALLFVPLLEAAREQGVSPDLGLARGPGAGLLQRAGGGGGWAAGAGGRRGQEQGGGGAGTGGGQQDDLLPGDVNAGVPRHVLAEEVLMYRRASSRLAEMTGRPGG